MATEPSEKRCMELTVALVAAYVSNNRVETEELPELIRDIHQTLHDIDRELGPTDRRPREPFVPISESVTPDYLICLEDGKRLKMLKRHLKTAFNMTPEDYRNRWDLPPDYPMVASNYAAQRSALAKKSKFGNRSFRSGK